MAYSMGQPAASRIFMLFLAGNQMSPQPPLFFDFLIDQNFNYVVDQNLEQIQYPEL